jgi:Rrf2 family protein
MNLSKTTEYAMRVLTTMALRKQELYTAENLYEELKIPRRYLRRLLTDLSKAGLISGSRGRTGGFVFNRDPGQITLKEIIDLVEGPGAMTGCILGFAGCMTGGTCALHHEWVEVRNKMNEVLTKTTLASLRK